MALHTPAPEVVWFKRDLRVLDHVPLAKAAAHGPVLAVHVTEPEWLGTPEFDAMHLEFQEECLAELSGALRSCGAGLLKLHGNLPEALEALRQRTGFRRLWSHEETGPGWTYARDRRVAAWCRESGVEWRELPQHGVVRRLPSRDGWAAHWERFMHLPPLGAPVLRSTPTPTVPGFSDRALPTLAPSAKSRQRGGESLAWETLESFLAGRGRCYQHGMSSPLSAETACSRLSPHLAWGCISIRNVTQRAGRAAADWAARRDADPGERRDWGAALRSFAARLHWHDHFIQKLEDEPRLEFENLHRGYDGLRDAMTGSEEGRRRLQAWRTGTTGFPMVDASIRSCLATGWLNFRMRAMLASFAAHQLWLHWREPAVFLARHFLDFEAGIHFPQFQMQSGTTGINTLRLYSPAKQALDQDPSGTFIRRWVPELRDVPLAYLAEPHRMPSDLQARVGCRIGRDYPAPIVNHASAYREARTTLGRLRAQPAVREQAQRVYLRHGSRRQPVRPEFGRPARATSMSATGIVPATDPQMDLFGATG